METSKIDESKEKAKLKEAAINIMISKYGWLQEVKRYDEVINEQKNGLNKKNNGDNQ